ncbi:MAG: hypothetical protein A2X64_09460 [Ignavibacteria bacterium GWF2_33_9]|nr:MAG: hypothetical protein A2X64_09460 [Ignavibacteria bacterium GWF2_33_9]
MFLASCENSVEKNVVKCDNEVILDTATSNHGIYDQLICDTAWIDGDCLRAKISYEGDFPVPILDLVWDGNVMESYPQQVRLKLCFFDIDNGADTMHIEIAYDISILRVGGTNNTVIIHLDRWKQQLLYHY